MNYTTSLFFILCVMVSFPQNSHKYPSDFAVNDTINDAKVIAFASKLQNTLYKSDVSFFLDNFNSVLFTRKVIINDSVSSKNKDIQIFNKAFKNGVLKKFDVFPKKIIESIKNGASYDVVNYYYDTFEKKYHLLFRAYSENDGLNYHDYQLNYTNEKFSIEDIYIYITGEYVSDTIKQLYMINLPKTLVESMDYSERRMNSILFFYEYKELMEQEKYKEAYNLLSNLKGDIKDQKVIYVMKIQVASAINEIYYMEAIDELLKKFPDDPSTQLIAVDYYVMLKNYNASIAALNTLQTATNDSFVTFIRGNLSWQFDDYENAEKAYKTIMQEFPNFEEVRLNLVYMYDEAKMFESCIEILDDFITKDYYTKQNLINFIDDTTNKLENIPTTEIYLKWKNKK